MSYAALSIHLLSGSQAEQACPHIAGVAGYTWVAVIHVLLGFSFKTTLNIANLTSIAWLLCYYFLLKPPVRAPGLHSIVSCIFCMASIQAEVEPGRWYLNFHHARAMPLPCISTSSRNLKASRPLPVLPAGKSLHLHGEPAPQNR